MLLENAMYGFLELGQPYDIRSFGGLDAVLGKGPEVGASTVPEYFLDLVLPYRNERPHEVDSFLADVIDHAESDLSLLDIVSRIGRYPIQTDGPGKRIFARFLSLFGNRANDRSVRVAALKGAYLTALGHERLLTRLSSRIVEIEDEGELPIIADAARVAGLILAVRQDAGLVEFLKVFEAFPPCADQIKLELGLLELGKALSAQTLEETIRQFASARDYFWASHTARSSRYEAQSYALAIDILVGFFEGRDTSSLRNIIADLKTAAFAYDAYVSQSDPDPLLGMIAAQTTAFTTLAIRLLNLSESLSKKTWLHAAEVVKEQLLVAYTANSALFNGGRSEGVDLLTRPRIERSLLDNHLYMAAMEQWLDTYGASIDSKTTEDIRLFLEGQTKNPLDAEAADRTASALIQKVNGQVGSTELAEIMEFRKARMRERTSPFIVRAIAHISAEFSNLEGFGDQLARLAFMDLALGVISFAEDRLDSSYEQNHQAGYLFHHVNQNPIEKNLHQDFLGWSRSRGMGIDDEIRGIGGGRADLRYSYEGYQIIVEVKQEGRDASFDGLISRYGSQTTQYQVTNARFGVLLVLDKSRALQEPEHLEDIYKAIVIDKGSHRHGVLVVKIAALRPRPSDASR